MTTQDHEEIRRWAEERGGQPASVEGTERGEKAGLLRIDFPDREADPELKPISWDQFFKKFDREHLVFLYQDKPRSYFNKFISEGTASEKGSRSASKRTVGSRSGNGRSNGSGNGSSGGNAGTGARRASTRARSGGEHRASTATGEKGNSRRGSSGRRTTTAARKAGGATARARTGKSPARTGGSPARVGARKRSQSRGHAKRKG